MKKVTFLSVLLVVSFIASSQEKIDALSFIETFDWKTTPTDFQARNEKIILPKTDSLYALWGTEEAYIINDLDIDGIGFYAVVNFLGGNNFCYPVIFMYPSNSATDLSAQKIFDNTKLHINKRYGETKEITSTKDSQIIPVSDLSRELIWEKKFFRLSLSMNYVNNAETVFLSVMPDIENFFSEYSPTKAESYSPEIQNKFSGLTLGNKYSTEQVKALAIERGSFLKIEKVSNISILCFKNFYFGGHKWDFCNFWLNQNGEFYMFEVYCSYELGSMYKEEAESLFKLVEDYFLSVPELTIMKNDVYARFAHINFSKGTALLALEKHLGITPSETLSAGDYYNDIPMLRSDVTASPVAPANALPEIKDLVLQEGGYISDYPAGQGVLDGIIHYLNAPQID